MEENIKKILDQIREHIINCAFKDKSKKHKSYEIQHRT